MTYCIRLKYRPRAAIISRGLYTIFHCSLYCRVVSITDNLCTKQGNSSKKSMVYNQERFQIKSGYNGACTVDRTHWRTSIQWLWISPTHFHQLLEIAHNTVYRNLMYAFLLFAIRFMIVTLHLKNMFCLKLSILQFLSFLLLSLIWKRSFFWNNIVFFSRGTRLIIN